MIYKKIVLLSAFILVSNSLNGMQDLALLHAQLITLAQALPNTPATATSTSTASTEPKATSAATQEISIASTNVTDRYILEARNKTVTLLKDSWDSKADKQALLSDSIYKGHLNKLFTAYLNALREDNEDKLKQVHAALYYIANNYPQGLGQTPIEIKDALRDRGFDQPVLNTKYLDYELRQMEHFVKTKPEDFKFDQYAKVKKNRYERQLGEWGASDLLKKLFPALVPKIAELLPKVQAVQIQ